VQKSSVQEKPSSHLLSYLCRAHPVTKSAPLYPGLHIFVAQVSLTGSQYPSIAVVTQPVTGSAASSNTSQCVSITHS